MTTRVLSVASQTAAADRTVAPKRGFVSISRGSYSSSSSSSSGEDSEVIDIPEVLNSRETLEFCGFIPEVAAMIFESWERQQIPGELGYGNDVIVEARYFVYKRAQNKGDASTREHNWRRALTDMGITQRLSDAILNSRFDVIRQKGPASYWALDSINIAWEFLEGLDKRIRKKQAELRELNTPSPSVQPRPAKRSQSGLADTFQEAPVLKLATMGAIPTAVEGRTMLYKGGAMTRLAGVFKEDGSLDLLRLHSSPPTDFHQTDNDLLYLTKHYDVAEKYAGFVRNRVDAEEGAVLHFAVPSDLLQDG
ncbi:hypothetical protein OQA88_9116 [Cercophora sp. LCS_1]